MKVAIVHDYLTQRGGAERVVLSLQRLFPDAPIYTSLYDPDTTYDDFRELDVRPSRLQRIPHRDRGRALLPLYPAVFDTLRLRGYDLVISSSSGFAHGTRVIDGFHLCYCYTPPRWLYLTDRYLAEGGPAPAWARPALPAALAALRAWDRRAATRPDAYVAVSRVAARRIEEVYGRRAEVVHPPAPGARLPSSTVRIPEEPYFLAVSRLLPYKRVDVAIRACRQAGVKLVVVGTGPAWNDLQQLGHDLVEFRPFVSEGELGALLAGCTALIQPGAEDFGLMPLEANAAGRPAVVLARDGALETVLDGITGVHVPEDTAEAFVDGIETALDVDWSDEKLRSHAESFSEHRFHEAILRALGREGVLDDEARDVSTDTCGAGWTASGAGRRHR